MRFNDRQASTKTVNKAGGVAYSMKPEQELIHAVLTTFLEDKFYESGDERLVRIQLLIKQCAPEFVQNLAVVARTEFHMRTVPMVLIGELAKNKTLNYKVIPQVINRVDEMAELIGYVGKPIPNQVRKGLRRAVLNFDRYQLAKYRGLDRRIKLRDVFNLIRPNPKHADKEQKKAWKDLMTGKLVPEDTWEKVISTAKNKKKAWEGLINENKLGYMAMIRNLNNFIKEGISKDAQKKVCEFLTTPKKVYGSKQLPFRYLTAYENVKGNIMFTDAISEAMDIALDNVPNLDGKTLIAVDCSGSMMGETFDKACAFGATLMKASKDVDLILFDEDVHEVTISRRTPIVDIIQKLKSSYMGGGTETSLVFSYAHKEKYDRIIIISDNESWQERYRGSSVQEAYNNYKANTQADPSVYCIDIEGYGTKDITGNVTYLTGWSDRLLDFIKFSEEGIDLVKYVKEFNY